MLGFKFRPTWRSPFIGINRFEASAEENVPYDKINVRPRSSSDIKKQIKADTAVEHRLNTATRAHNQGNIGLYAVA